MWKINTQHQRKVCVAKVKTTSLFDEITHYEKKRCFALALQLNFWVTNDTFNSLYLYAMSSNGQVAWIAKLQFTIYMVQLIVIQLQLN
jgi:hypothetical protein